MRFTTFSRPRQRLGVNRPLMGDRTNQGLVHFNIHGLLRVRTNVRLVPRLPSYFRVDSVDPNFELKSVSTLEPPNPGRVKSAVGYPRTCDLGDGEVYYECPIPFLHYLGVSTRWRFLVRGLAEEDTRITTDFPFGRLRPIGIRLTDLFSRIAYAIMTIKLTRRGTALCHASAIAHADEAYLFFAYGGTGKTTVTQFLMGTGCDGYLSDDYAVIDRHGRAYCWPEYYPPHSTEKGTPGLRYLFGQYRKTSTPAFRIQKDARAKTIFFLEQGPDGVLPIEREEAVRRILLLNMEEMSRLWNSPVAQILTQYAYFYPNLDMARLAEDYRSCIEDFVRSVASSYVLRSSSPTFEMSNELASSLGGVM